MRMVASSVPFSAPDVDNVAQRRPVIAGRDRRRVEAQAGAPQRIEGPDRHQVIHERAQRVRIAAGALGEHRHRVGTGANMIGEAQGGGHTQRHRREQAGHRPQPLRKRVVGHGQSSNQVLTRR